jgi:3,4-dihydroxy 2-butanone 4-phosphate synthase/GTP cyclohydrolase II
VREGSTSDDIVSPGHVFPLITRSGGVGTRRAAAEAAIDLCHIAGVGDAAVLCSIAREDGSMARIEEMGEFASRFSLPIVDVQDIVDHLQR